MDVVQSLAAILFVIALLGGALLLLKKRGVATFRLPGISGSAAARIEVVERISLGPQHALYLVRADGRFLLIGTSPGSCRLLDEQKP